MTTYDDGRHSRELRADARVDLAVAPVGTRVWCERLDGSRELVGRAPLSTLILPPGSLVLSFEVPGHVPARLPILLTHGETLQIRVALPPLASAPPGMLYVPAGRFLFGSEDSSVERRGYLQAAPLHEVWTQAYFIARHEVTFGEWTDVQGQASVKCVYEGSHVIVHFSGLIPNGQYTCWIVAFDAPGFNGSTLANAFTFGPLGLQDGSQNGFVADADGDGQITGTLPPGPMSLIHTRDFDGCLTDEFEFHVAIVYHGDGLTHGAAPGPVCTWAVQRAVVFKP